MLEWHDCKTDPPKEDGDYLLITKFGNKYYWDKGHYIKDLEYWETEEFGIYSDNDNNNNLIKWAEVELPE